MPLPSTRKSKFFVFGCERAKLDAAAFVLSASAFISFAERSCALFAFAFTPKGFASGDARRSFPAEESDPSLRGLQRWLHVVRLALTKSLDVLILSG